MILTQFQWHNQPITLRVHDDQLGNSIHCTQAFHEAEILDYLADKYPTHRIILDIGANVGNHTVYFATFLRYLKILAFEPVPSNFELLQANTSCFSNVNLFQMALSDSARELGLVICPYNMGACHVAGCTGTFRTQATTLDSYNFNDVTLVKLDVEEHEMEVLKGGSQTLLWNKPLLLMEVAVRSRPQLEEYLQTLGYELEKFWEKPFTALYRPL